MQLNLLTRLGERVVMSRAGPPSTLPGAWRDSATAQLEALARANQRAAARARYRRRLWTVGLFGVALLWAGAMWRQAIDPPRVPVPMLAQASSVAPGEALAVVVASPLAPEAPVLPTAPATAGAQGPAASDAVIALVSSVVTTDAVPVVANTDDEAARKARALARHKAAQERARLAQEAERQRQLALITQLDAERALQQQQQAEAAARERAAAAERERRQAALLLAQNTRRGVAELCGSAGGWAAEQQCQARQCWKAEHQGDAVCLRLREGDMARLQRGADH